MNTALSDWLSLWHRRHRHLIVWLFVTGALAAALAYGQNYLLAALTQSLVVPAGAAGQLAAGLEARDWPMLAGLFDLADHLGTGFPAVCLGAYVLAHLGFDGLEYLRIKMTGRLRMGTRDDIEAQVLVHLLGQDDAFLGRHAPAETVNRLATDLNRVCERRANVVRVWWSAALILGHLAFFLQRDWRLAAVAAAACVGVGAWTGRTTRRIKDLDRGYLAHDDRVKSRFEDFLRAAPEIQVGRLQGAARTILRELQQGRSAAYLKFVALSGSLRLGDLLSALAAIAGTVGVVMAIRAAGETAAALALLPVVVLALPNLFRYSSDLIHLHVDFQLARTSEERLAEYAHAGPDPLAPLPEATAPLPPPVLALRGVFHAHAGPDGDPCPALHGIDAEFQPGRWHALAGRAGSGKTTLVNLLLGRLVPGCGEVLADGRPLDPARRHLLFSYLPQSPALLGGTIADNLLFGRPAGSRLEPADLELLGRLGVGRLCRLKGLDMPDGATGATWRDRAGGGPETDLLLERLEADGRGAELTALGLSFQVGRQGANLSGGQGRLIALGRVLLRRTPVMILDEPTASLDPRSTERVADLLAGLRDEGRLLITVSHDPDFIARADEVLLLDEGRIAARGSFERVSAAGDLFRRAIAEARAWSR